MALSLQTNSGSLSAQSNLNHTFNRLNVSLERLSTGMKVNKAADDATSMVVSEIHRAQLTGLEQSVRNIDRAVGLVQTAEGALGEISGILTNLRQLAVEASNVGAFDHTSAAENQKEIDKLLASINNIADTTRFGSKQLLNGESGLIADSNTDAATALKASGELAAGEYEVVVTQAATRASVLAKMRQGELQATGTFTLADSRSTLRITALNGVENGNQGDAQDTTGNGVGVQIVEGAADDAQYIDDGNSKTILVTLAQLDTRTAADVRDVINRELGDIHQSPIDDPPSGTFVATLVSDSGRTLTAADATTYSNVTSGGQDEGSVLTQDEILTINDVAINLTAGMNQTDVISRINEFSTQTGVTAMVDTKIGNSGKTLLVSNVFGSDGNITVTSNIANSPEGNGGSGFGAYSTGTATDIQGTINGVVAMSRANTLSLSGLTVEISGDAENPLNSYGTDTTATITVTDRSRKFQIGAFSGLTTDISLDAVQTAALGHGAEGTSMTNLSQIGVSSFRQAQSSLRVIDQAITDVAVMRGTLGAFQKKTLEATQSSLRTRLQNIQDAESSESSTDYAVEIARYTSGLIRSQAVSSVLGLTSQNGQTILSLLQG